MSAAIQSSASIAKSDRKPNLNVKFHSFVARILEFYCSSDAV